MPTYEYQCRKCGFRLEVKHGMTERYDQACPICSGELSRLVSGGAGFIMKGNSQTTGTTRQDCGHATPCCGRAQRCDKPPCHEH
ncbi:zinc ribbon domain-containing protein [bacterium]|nr:zinc ribbon domain-containing protein [bacterium]